MKKLTMIACVLAGLAAAGPAYAADGPDAAAKAKQQQKLDKMAGRATARVVYAGVTLIDGLTDQLQQQRDMAIVVDGERINAILPMSLLTAKAMEGAELVDARGMIATPGLIDAHVHYATHPMRAAAEAELKRDIYGGLTGVRDMAGDARALADLSRAALINEIPAPDLYYAALVAGPSFFNDPRTVLSSLGLQPGQVPWLYAVTDETPLPLAVAQARGTGATGLKIYANLSGELVKKLVSEARRQDFPVWTHMQVYPATPYDSLGATSVSHVCMIARYVREAGKSSYGHANEPSYAGLSADDPGIQQYVAALARSGTVLDATLSVYLPPPGADPAAPSGKCPAQLAGDITRAMHRAGVPIDAGTDTDSVADDPYPALYGELQALVRYAGFTPYEALVAATRVAAQALGKLNEIGTLEPGKLANIAFFAADPTQNLANLHSIAWTVKRGHRYNRSEYRHRPIPSTDD